MYKRQDVDTEENEARLRATLDTRRLSKQKLETMQAIVQKSDYQTFGEYLFPLIRHHAQWASINESSFEREHHYTRGYLPVYKPEVLEDQRNMTPVDQPKAVNEDSAYYLSLIHISNRCGKIFCKKEWIRRWIQTRCM